MKFPFFVIGYSGYGEIFKFSYFFWSSTVSTRVSVSSIWIRWIQNLPKVRIRTVSTQKTALFRYFSHIVTGWIRWIRSLFKIGYGTFSLSGYGGYPAFSLRYKYIIPENICQIEKTNLYDTKSGFGGACTLMKDLVDTVGYGDLTLNILFFSIFQNFDVLLFLII